MDKDLRKMTKDTERALEIIKPIAEEIGIPVSADKEFLYCGDIGIGISCNSTWATVMEFIGYAAITKYNNKFRDLELKPRAVANVKRYWYTQAQIEDIMGKRKES